PAAAPRLPWAGSDRGDRPDQSPPMAGAATPDRPPSPDSRASKQPATTHGWTSASGPVLVQPGAVLATVKDAARRASSRGGLRPSLTAAARGRPGGRQAGTKKRPLAAEPRNATK